MAQDAGNDDLSELRDLLKRALDEGDEEAKRVVVAEAALGVLAFDLKDELGETGNVLAAEAQDMQSQLDL